MREDMAKVVADKPHRGGKGHPPKGENRKKDWEKKHEAESKTEPVRDKWGRRRFWGRYKPIANFLNSKIGCKWDDVYSEICDQMSKNSIAQKYFRDQVFNMVSLDCFEYNGQVYDPKWLPIGGTWRDLYVLDGILCKAERKRTKYVRPKAKFQAGICPLLYNGIWYEVTLKMIDNGKYNGAGLGVMPKEGVRDKFLGWVQTASVLIDFYGATLYCTKKRQMNKREIKRMSNA